MRHCLSPLCVGTYFWFRRRPFGHVYRHQTPSTIILFMKPESIISRSPDPRRHLSWASRIIILDTPGVSHENLVHSSCGWEGARSTLLQEGIRWEHQKSIRNHQKSMILNMNQDTYGNFQRYQESPGMICDTTRCHKAWFQEVDFLKISRFWQNRGGTPPSALGFITWGGYN